MKQKIGGGDQFGRIHKKSAPEVGELYAARAHPATFDAASYYCQMQIHRAHVTMLAEEGIIARGEAKTLLAGLRRVEEREKQDPRLASYMSTEAALIEEVGEAGGRMHIGRSRNDLGHTQRRLFIRDQELRVIDAVVEFQKKLTEAAARSTDAVMPGYTHMRQAQPITLAHYLLAHAEAAARSVERLEDAYKRTNLSPLGGAALAGTGWPLNRERTMGFLGFDGLVLNTLDGVASTDYCMEFASALAIHMSNISRLAEDLQVWSSDEYMLVDLDEAYAGTSSIMPQKKNPVVLEQAKAYAAESLGDLVALVASTKAASYTNVMDRLLIEPVSVETAVGCTRVMGGVVETLMPLRENMLRHLRAGFSTATDLADALVRKHGIGFRQAHDIVAEVTLMCIRDGKKAEEISSEMIREASQKTLGNPLELPQREIEAATNPVLNVERRKVPGGTSPGSVREMIKVQRRLVQREEKRSGERRGRIKVAFSSLEEAERAL